MKVTRALYRAMLALSLVFAGVTQSAAATGFAGGKPWQINDVVVCENGTCNVLRISGSTVTLLDQFSDGLLGANNGVAIDNTLHVLVTDNGASNSGTSNVVKYTIASIDPLPNPGVVIPHTGITTSPFNDGGANAQAVVVDAAGHIFVGNAGSGGSPTPTIAEFNSDGAAPSSPALGANPFTLPANCTDNKGAALYMDLSPDGSAFYITTGGPSIQKLTISSHTCAPFANFGGNVQLYGIKDIPAAALPPNCGSSVTPSTACPGDESILVIATGNTDPDATTGETEAGPDPDATNICTNQSITTSPQVSCALLLDTSASDPGLTASLWQASNPYSLGTHILDPYLHQQTVFTAGTSGSDEPAFTQTSEAKPVIDNAVTWMESHPTRAGSQAYVKGAVVIDTDSPTPHVQQVTLAGITGPGVSFAFSDTGGTTIDGLQWQDQGAWQPNTLYTNVGGSPVGDLSAHIHEVFTAGTSGSALPSWNDGGGTTIDNAVTWTNQGPVVSYSANHLYALGTYTAPNGHIQQVVEPGTSGGTAPAFSTSGTRTTDNAVTWADLGQAVWRPSFSYGLNSIIVDGSGNVQQVTTTGTSGPGPAPAFSSSPTTDGLQWENLGMMCNPCSSPWTPGTPFAAGAEINDNNGVLWGALTSGTSGLSANRPAFESNDSTASFVLVDNAVVWTSRGALAGSTFQWTANNPYVQDAQIVDPGNHVQVVSVAGTSGPAIPAFMDGGTVVDNAVTWADLGQAVWRPNFSYGLNAIIVDAGGHVQQVTTAGTTGSGPTPPTFPDDGTSSTTDGSVVWADRGALAGGVFTWQAGNPYSQNAMIVDAAGDVELATNAGQSGAGPNPPAFLNGGNVLDGLVWMDDGPNTAWTASTSFPLGTLTVDPGMFLQKVTIAGVSTTPSHPAWNETLGSTTIDGLQWSDQGHHPWTANTLFSTVGALISDPATHAQAVFEAGTSGATQPTFNDAGGTTIDNAVEWTDLNPQPVWQANHAYGAIGTAPVPSVAAVANTFFVDPNGNLQTVHVTGTSGPVEPGSSGDPVVWSAMLGGTTIDGLQWSNQTPPATSVVTRYPVNGTTTLQSLSLDPLIADCTGTNCQSSAASLKTSNFWLGDSQSANFYKLDFATGTPMSFNANLACNGCTSLARIQGLSIYGAEGANQPGLTKLLTTTLQSSNSFTANVNFPLPSNASTNSWTVTAYGTASNALIPTTLYASLINKTGGATDPNTQQASGSSPNGQFEGNNFPCQPTASGNCVVWKADLQLPTLASVLAENINAPAGTIDNGTDVFVDEHYDVTDAVGTIDPPGKTYGSVHSLNEVPSQFQTSNGPNLSGCTYVSPSPAGGCFKSGRGTLPIEFKCTNVPFNEFQNLQNKPGPPLLSIVETFPTKNPKPAPEPITLTSTNAKAPYRFNGTDYIFNWSPNGITGNFEACTFDPTGTVQTFCTTFVMKTSCP